MARRQRKSEAPVRRREDGLEAPFPAGPAPQAKHVVYAYRLGTDRMICLTFGADYSAKKFIDIFLDGREYKWLKPMSYSNDAQLEVDGIIKLRSSTLEDLMEYEYSPAEEAYELPIPYGRQARQLMLDLTVVEGGAEGEAPAKTKREKREPKPKIDRTGKTSIQDIAAELKMDAKEARTILRKLKIEKPAGGWLFDPAAVEDIKKKLSDNRK